MNTHQFLWLDLETTGLYGRHTPLPGDLEASGQILEWALVLAADDVDGDMSVVDAYEGTIGHRLDTLQMDDFVRDMHTKNGLLAEVETSDVTLESSDEFLVGTCRELGAQPRSVSLAGNSVHFDLAWCRVHFPRFAEYLSHRVFDVSTLLRAHRSWGGEDLRAEPAHRALDDVLASLEAAKRFRQAVGWL